MKKYLKVIIILIFFTGILILVNNLFGFIKINRYIASDIRKENILLSTASNTTLTFGDEKSLYPKTTREDVNYKSNNKKIVYINKAGKLIAKNVGKTTLDVYINGKKENSIKVKVKPAVIDIALFAGQSNMVGWINSPSEVKLDRNTAFEYRKYRDEMYPLNDPVGENGNGAKKSYGGSLLPSFAYYYTKNTNKKLLVVHSAFGGTNIEEWQPNGNLYKTAKERYISAVKYIKKNKNYKIDKKFYVWLQGETDGKNGTKKDEYKKLFLNLNRSLEKEMGVKQGLIIRIGNWPKEPLEDMKQIFYAQNELAYEYDDLVMGTKNAYNYSVNENYMKKDMLHYNNIGLDKIGKESALNYVYFLKNKKEKYLDDEFLPQTEIFTLGIKDKKISSNIKYSFKDLKVTKKYIKAKSKSYFKFKDSVNFSKDSMWAVEYKGKVNSNSRENVLLTDNKDSYIKIYKGNIIVKLSDNNKITFSVNKDDLKEYNNWRIEYLSSTKEISLFKNGSFVSRLKVKPEDFKITYLFKYKKNHFKGKIKSIKLYE